MLDIIHDLQRGKAEVVDQFVAAKEFWDGFFEEHRSSPVDDLAKALGSAQWKIEGIFGRGTGKAVMPYTALGALYDPGPGFEDNAKLAERVIKAFEASMCSLEVKFAARRAAIVYHLD